MVEREREREVLAVIERVLREELSRGAPVDPGQRLRDLALDSLELTVLVVELEDRFRVRLDAGDAGEETTLGDLARLVAARARARAPDEEEEQEQGERA